MARCAFAFAAASRCDSLSSPKGGERTRVFVFSAACGNRSRMMVGIGLQHEKSEPLGNCIRSQKERERQRERCFPTPASQLDRRLPIFNSHRSLIGEAGRKRRKKRPIFYNRFQFTHVRISDITIVTRDTFLSRVQYAYVALSLSSSMDHAMRSNK